MATTSFAADRSTMDDAVFDRLRRFNLIVGLIHLVQAGLMLALSNDFSLPVTGSFLNGPPGSDAFVAKTLFDLPLGLAVAAFLLLAAVDHLLMAAPGVNAWYNRLLRRGVNRARWWEYSISASLMMILIAMICGVSDVSALVAIFGANAAMILFGWVMEEVNDETDRLAGRVDWRPYLFGCVAGVVPWIAVTIQVVGAETESTGDGIPTFVYGIILSLFLLFNTFSINMVLQYKRVGRWRDYLYGERSYIVLSLVAKTALAWQVFANVLVN